ncbi:MAG TPA: glutamine--fructose-6-phosphate transaminase (isomerizing) [Thermoanaerobaculia bacterium]|jgi:glucosamine--fructose-6-phosphate aminotransferase (isomerizing)|nr:glutamine--fructose-6-phosphate transaminase (isomerizing) [Thermoanaerobaculia bacterium]
MCGIIGYVGTRDVVPVLIGALKKLEYRGYDSAGVAVVNGDGVDPVVSVIRAEGKLSNLEAKLEEQKLHGSFGMGHTRWATHGKPNENNAHPHRDCTGNVIVIHNGIIENFLPLKQRLKSQGHEFKSETDTEVVAHLIEEYRKSGLSFVEAVKKSLKELDGHYALVMIAADDPGTIIAAKQGPPLVIGLGENENIVASDVAPLLAYTRNIIYLEDGEYAILDDKKVEVFTPDDQPVDRAPTKILWDAVMAEKEGYRHYMLKEIHEQSRAVRDTFTGRMFEESGEVFFNDLQFTPEEWAKFKRVHIVACGTSWHSALVGKFLVENAGRIPVEVDYGSEYRYRDPIVDENTLVIGVTQSGETADTIAGMQEAKRKGARLISICNVIGSAATRMSDGVIYTNAGPEIGVASTKAFTTQLTAFYLLSLYIRQLRGDDKDDIRYAMHELSTIPHKIEHLLKSQEKKIQQLANRYHNSQDFLFLGRGVHYPIALEGALKLKEISYIHAEGYPAGEMKHGPIALIDENMPIVSIATHTPVYDKVVSNLQEVKARDGKLIVICDEGDEEMQKLADEFIEIPWTIEPLQPILAVIPTQLLAYYIALRRGCDVDQPRNLAKSVTVE